MGLLEALSEAAPTGPSMESQAGSQGVLRAVAEFTEADEAAAAEEVTPVIARAESAE